MMFERRLDPRLLREVGDLNMSINSYYLLFVGVGGFWRRFLVQPKLIA
jgi:hypothetical protein